ncbi:glycine--tRNA ligase subunit beta [Anaeromyxobacter diazotrophicus]|uniref:Glycine--tRNA ligase beta subunit n=1 Tax=Anaeromyxobacter diazotrophicus TaxID=2590199 RepID=A0A7I9VT68_9BACT|nr:glycine--tRNA ligase subunit beta [Anaeromyxobacter diazotrophicus]GEJ59137.1 glycine--tRNA ligase beta subunit [Anaeromyxobacter diazotrophicus]
MAHLLFEIGSEEIPAGFVPPALRQLTEDLTKALDEARLAHGEVKAVGTPRRLCVWARDVAAKQPDAKTEALGPSVQAAFDAEGKPTAAALGFAKSQGVEVEALARVQTPKGERLAAHKVEKGQRAEKVLPALLEKLVAGLRFKKAMRWGDTSVTFARPMRWMTALYGGKVVKVRYGDIVSGAVSYGHRFKAPRAVKLTGAPEDYLAKLRKAFVLADPAERRVEIQKQLAAAAKKGGGAVRPDEALLEQVTYLVEHPTAVLGEFEASNLELPAEVVISEQRNHQRYFAVLDGERRLTNRFIAVSGTPVKDPKVARNGYQRVLRARLADARFFFEEDRKRRLEDRVQDLGRRTYQAKLGTELERVERIERIAGQLAAALGLSAQQPAVARVARLCKADLGTGMVGEFPELQGVMGGHYARLDGEPAEVADGIEDHYKPIGAAEDMPRGDAGALVGLADRLHQLVGILGVGEKATGAADPFGLRRAAIGIVRIVQARGYHLSLGAAVDAALDALAGKVGQDRAAVKAQVLDFLRGRLKAQWSDEFEVDLVEAVLAAGFDDLVDARQRLAALADVKRRPDFVPLAVAFKRVANIQEKAKGEGGGAVDPAQLRDEAERRLLAEVERVEAAVAVHREAARRDYAAVLRTVAELKPAVDRFFDEVLVMAEEPALRANRLALVKRVAALFADVADFRKIQAELPPGAAPARAAG